MALIADLEAQGRIKRQVFTAEEITETLQRARDELDAARMVAGKHPETAFKLAYEAMFLAGSALLQKDGYRLGADGHHKTLVDYLEQRIGPLDMGLVNELDEARKKRNWSFYDRRKITNRELQHILATADRFVEFISNLL